MPNPLEKKSPPAGARSDWVLGLLLVFAIILVYQPVWAARYVWDDDLVLTANPVIIGPLGLREIWTTNAADICPLTLTTFWVEHALWGLAPRPYHLVNVFLHAASAVVLWRVLRGLLVPGAWLGAALWALHPVQVESVAWVAEMKNTESALFYLLTIFFFVRWLRPGTEGESAGRGWNYALTILFSVLALTAKSSTVILPGVLCLCAWWIEGRWRWRNLARVAPIFFLAVVAAALSLWTQHLQLNIATDPQYARAWPERIAASGDAVWFYLGKLFWPHPLLAIYPRWVIDPSQWNSYVRLVATMLVLAIFWLKREAWSRAWFFASAYFLLALLPVLGFAENYIFRYSLVFDHFQYLASIGPLALAGAGIDRWRHLLSSDQRWLKTSLLAAPLLVLALLSWSRTWAYQNEETLWTDTLAKNPSAWIAHDNLGNVLLQNGNVVGAMNEFEKALALNPNYDLAYFSLGNGLIQLGHVDEAVAAYQKALAINPNLAKAHSNLGNIFLQRGQLDDAISEYEQATKIEPYYPQAHNNLGYALFQKGRVGEAIIEYQKALALKPDYAQARQNLAAALARKGG